MPNDIIIDVKEVSSSRRHLLRIAAVVLIFLLCLAVVMMFRGAGRWLVREDALRPADVMVVISGAMPARAEEAAEIFKMGYTHDVWITRPESPSEDLKGMGISYVGEEEYSRQVLIHSGVPQEAVHVLPDPAIDTEQEIDEVALQMRLENLQSVIIVTSPQHTRRVRTLWHKLVGNEPAVIVRAAWQDDFDADHWWRNTHDAFAVVREMMGLMNAWFGLPVRPHAT